MNQAGHAEWVWVIVIEPDGDPQYLGQQDAQNGVAYIPVFAEKEHAQQGMLKFSLAGRKKYEVQAVQYRDLAADAAANGFMLFMLDAEGKLIEKISP